MAGLIPSVLGKWVVRADFRTTFIHKAIADAQGRIQPLDEQIGSLKAQIHDLQAALFQFRSRRDEVAENVRRHQFVLSSVRRAPAELICEIFLAALSSEDGVSKPPWYLGHICRSWRHYALSYPALWASITISSSPRSLSMLRVQFARSANALLDIHWRCVDDRMDPDLLYLLLSHPNRWRTLSLHERGRSDFGWLQSMHGRLEQLQKVQVSFKIARAAFPVAFSTAPNLREAILTDEQFSRSPIIDIPWERLTHYRGAYMPDRQLEILRAAAPTLQECVLGFIDDAFPRQPSDTMTMPNLRRLSSQYVAVLAHLTAPTLETLRLVLGPESISLVAPFVLRSACTLTRLTLIQCDMSDVLPVLRTLSSLTSLFIWLGSRRETTPTEWTTAMSISGTPADICPRLTSLEFGCLIAIQLEILGDPFFAMARSRFHTLSGCRSRLSCLRLLSADSTPAPANMLAHTKTLQEEGFDVAILYGVDLMHADVF
ncbi:hypothetical protein C8R47DRAFT_1081670 [Mycena vitilis]|nr:hypothetical protein C8R47DRAFT_1081670 [Mycena vitilis]